MANREEFKKCRFCEHWDKCNEECMIGGKDEICDEFYDDLRSYNKFRLDPQSAINKAKEYDITVTDVLNLMNACGY